MTVLLVDEVNCLVWLIRNIFAAKLLFFKSLNRSKILGILKKEKKKKSKLNTIC